jgi:hypothetical protein
MTDCNYEESLILRLEAASREFAGITLSDDEEYTRILNENTQALNRELVNYRKLKTDLSGSVKLSNSVKNQIREKYVPKDLYRQFDIATIRTAKELSSFVNLNQPFFRQVFPTQESVLDTVSSLDPTSFRTFESEYPSIAIRIRSGQVSSAEVNDLIVQNGLDPKLFKDQVTTKRKNIFDLLNSFLEKLGIGIGIMGSFCALVEDVFALAKGQRDLTGNSAQFLGNFTNVLGLINPKAGEVVGNVQELISLMQTAQQASTDVATNLQGALSTLAGALGIAMKFADILKAAQGDTSQESGIEVDWDFVAISAAITASDPKFLEVLSETSKPLGDINQDGIMDAADATALDAYVAETATLEVVLYVEKTFLPYLNKNAASFSEFSKIPSASQPGSSMPEIFGTLSSAASSIGAGPGAGDFGLSKILQTITTASSIISSIQSLVSGSKPVNIKGLFGQLDQILQLGEQAAAGMFTDFNKVATDYKKTVEDSLKEAEKLAVDEKPKTKEISDSNKESLEDNVTKALETSAENSKNLGPKLVEAVNKIRNGIRQLAAVGVLEDLDKKLTDVVDKSVAELKSKVGLFSPESIGNGFNANMLSSFGKMAGKIAKAALATSDDTTKMMKESIKGLIAQSSEKFRQKNKEEVEFVALRFCKLAAEIERMYKDVTSPIEQITANFTTASSVLTISGADVTLRAVKAGAIRLTTEDRIAAMKAAGTLPATLSSPFVTAAGVRSTVPPAGTFPMGVVPPLPADYEFPTLEEAKVGKGGILYAPGPSSRISGDAGFITKDAGGGVSPIAMRNLYALARSWGRTITVISAYRNQKANAAAKGEKDSQHLAGTAFDCDINIYQEQIIFANLAYLAGFRGFGSYLGKNTFIHIDLGPERDWTQGGFEYYSLPGPPGAKVG